MELSIAAPTIPAENGTHQRAIKGFRSEQRLAIFMGVIVLFTALMPVIFDLIFTGAIQPDTFEDSQDIQHAVTLALLSLINLGKTAYFHWRFAPLVKRPAPSANYKLFLYAWGHEPQKSVSIFQAASTLAAGVVIGLLGVVGILGLTFYLVFTQDINLVSLPLFYPVLATSSITLAVLILAARLTYQSRKAQKWYAETYGL